MWDKAIYSNVENVSKYPNVQIQPIMLHTDIPCVCVICIGLEARFRLSAINHDMKLLASSRVAANRNEKAPIWTTKADERLHVQANETVNSH